MSRIELPPTGMMNSSRSMNADPGELTGVVGMEMPIGRDLTGPVGPFDQRHIPGEARPANQLGAAIGAAVVVQHEQIDADHPVERDPFQKIRRLVLENRADGDLVHGLPLRLARSKSAPDAACPVPAGQDRSSARSRGTKRSARVSSISRLARHVGEHPFLVRLQRVATAAPPLELPVLPRLGEVVVYHHDVMAPGRLDRVGQHRLAARVAGWAVAFGGMRRVVDAAAACRSARSP